MNKVLRITRIVVSVAAMLLLTLWLTASVALVPGVAQWIERVQFIPAAMSFSLVTFVGWLIVTLVFGRVYCSTVCPMGTLQDVAARAVRLGRRAELRVYRYAPAHNRLRCALLIVMVGCVMGGVYVVASILGPFGAYRRVCVDLLGPALGQAAAVSTVSVGVSAFILLAVCLIAARSGRLVCNTVCPVGTTLGFISRYSIFQMDIDTDKCINCRRCEYVCKSQCIDLQDHVVDGSRCVNCFDCINVCPNDAIRYTTSRKQLSIPMMQAVKDLGKQPEVQMDDPTGLSNNCDTTEQTQEE